MIYKSFDYQNNSSSGDIYPVEHVTDVLLVKRDLEAPMTNPRLTNRVKDCLAVVAYRQRCLSTASESAR